jgi:hypothetical protein
MLSLRIQSAEEAIAAELYEKSESFSLARESLQNCNDWQDKFLEKSERPKGSRVNSCNGRLTILFVCFIGIRYRISI